MKLRKILKSMFNNSKAFKDVPPGNMSDNGKPVAEFFLCPDDGGCDYR